METNNKQVKGIMVNGWYACQDEDSRLYVDQYLDLGDRLVLHYTKRQDNEEDACDEEGWNTDYDAKTEDARFYDSLEECVKAYEAVQAFREAKKKADTADKNKEIIDFLKKHEDALDHISGEMYFKEAGYTNKRPVSDRFLDKCEALEKAVEILIRKGLKLNTTKGLEFLPLDQIAKVKFNRDHESVTLTMLTNENVTLEKKGRMKRIYNAIAIIYGADIFID